MFFYPLAKFCTFLPTGKLLGTFNNFQTSINWLLVLRHTEVTPIQGSDCASGVLHWASNRGTSSVYYVLCISSWPVFFRNQYFSFENRIKCCFWLYSFVMNHFKIKIRKEFNNSFDFGMGPSVRVLWDVWRSNINLKSRIDNRTPSHTQTFSFLKEMTESGMGFIVSVANSLRSNQGPCNQQSSLSPEA